MTAAIRPLAAASIRTGAINKSGGEHPHDRRSKTAIAGLITGHEEHEGMDNLQTALSGQSIRLEPMQREHAPALAVASAVNPAQYRWSPVPQGLEAACRYIEVAAQWRAAGTAVPFVIVRNKDRAVVGSTRFWNLEHWTWPESHERHGRKAPDACEIGYTWLTQSAIGSGVNTEAKFLMLSYAFECWGVLRVCLHTDSRNERSRRAIERIGGQFEGVLRAHRIAADFTPRDSARYSILTAEWPVVKEKLHRIMPGIAAE
jgi:RimJ/RimL family protein N-acetyltransferase